MKRNLATGLGILALAAVAGIPLALSQPAPPAPAATPAEQTSPSEEGWPMPVEDFLAGNYLRPADVVLTRRDWNVTSWVIRANTGSSFSHAALVFTTPRSDPGIDETFVIEASPGGVDLTDLRDYLTDKSTFVAIKRINKEWFDTPKQSRVRGLLLNQIKASYSYGAVGQLARSLWFGFGQSLWGNDETVQNFKDREWKLPNEYICSGLVQLGYFQAILEYLKTGAVPPSALGDVVFLKDAARVLPQTEKDWSYVTPEQAASMASVFFNQQQGGFNAVLPEDLAVNERLKWMYFYKDGQVYKVSSYDEVRKLIGE